MLMSPKRILISGAGIAGLSLARQLKKMNIPYMMIEKRPHLSTEGAGIALPANAVRALKHVGLGDKVERHTHQVEKIIYTDTTGITLSEASLLEPPLNMDRFVALHRNKFHEILEEGVNESIVFNTQIDQLHQTDDGVIVKFNGANLQKEKFSAVIGADGVNSQVRKLAFTDSNLTDLGVTIWRWTSRYSTDNLQPTYMLGARDIFMAYPIGRDEVYCYAHSFDPENLKSKSSDHKAILTAIFGQYGGVAREMLQILPDNQFIIPGRLRSVPQPLFTFGRVALIGDAGHACSPMLQQGAACALEDVIALSELFKNFSIEDALSHYAKFRVERVNWITASSDGPMKMLINIDSQVLSAIQQKIRENGPLNVQGWRKLLSSDPINEIRNYIAAQKSCDKREGVVATAKL